MSILLIGQKSLPHPEQYYFPKEERIANRRVNKIKQAKYRTQLLHQIDENKQRKLREKQVEKTLQKQREIAILRELQRKYENRQKNYEQWYGHKSFLDRPIQDHQYKILQDQKVSSFNLPKLYNPYLYYWPSSYQSEYWRSYSRQNDDYVRPNYHRTIKTQNSVHRPESYDLSKNLITQNPEQRIKQLKDYQNRKFKEVYELLDQSIDAFHEANTKVVPKKKSNRLKKLNQKIKNKIIFANNVEENSQFYQLPYWSTKKPIKQAKGESEWQSWFAQQKLKELQQIAKNERLRQQVQDRLMGLPKGIKSNIQY